MADQPNRKSAHVKEQAMTYDDYSQLPEDGPRYELVRGELQMLPSASPRHQSVGVRLLHLLVSTCDLDYDVIHEVDVILSSTEVRRPDLVIIHRSRSTIVTERGIEGPPDIIVEILSRWSAKRDKIDKAETYATFRVPEYWVVDPFSQSLEQHVLVGSHYQLTDMYVADERIQSRQVPCASFTMNELMHRVIQLADEQ